MLASVAVQDGASLAQLRRGAGTESSEEKSSCETVCGAGQKCLLITERIGADPFVEVTPNSSKP